MPWPAEMPHDPPEAKKREPRSGLSPSRHSTTSSVSKMPSPMRGPYPQTSDDDAALDAGPMDPSSARETEVVKAVKAWIALIPPSPPLPAELEGKQKMGFLAKSRSQSSVEKKAI